MDQNIRVKCLCILNLSQYSKQGILSLIAENPVFMNDLQQEAQLLFQQLTTQQHQSPISKIYSQSGAWYSTQKNNICISLLVTAQYPITSAMRLLKQSEEILKRQISSGKYEFHQQEAQIRELLQAYDKDPYTDDKVEVTCKSVDSVQGLMEENIKKLQNNQEQLQVIHHKSADISQMATQFQKNATTYNTKMSCQTYILYGALAAIIIGVILYFII